MARVVHRVLLADSVRVTCPFVRFTLRTGQEAAGGKLMLIVT